MAKCLLVIRDRCSLISQLLQHLPLLHCLKFHPPCFQVLCVRSPILSPTPCFHTSLLPFFHTYVAHSFILSYQSMIPYHLPYYAFIQSSTILPHTLHSPCKSSVLILSYHSLVPSPTPCFHTIFYHPSTILLPFFRTPVTSVNLQFSLFNSPIYHLSHHAFMQSSTILPSTH